MIIEIRDNDPKTGGNTVTGDVYNSSGAYQGEQRFIYTITGDSVESWAIDYNSSDSTWTDATVYPVNYTILKARGNAGARVYHFGGEGAGAVSDSEEPATGLITAVSFCYGLSVGIEPVEPPIVLADLPACEELSNSELYTTGIICPVGTGAEKQLIINMSLNDPNFGFNFDDETVRACTCNVELKACNPELAAVPAGTQDENTPPDERSCMEFDDSGTTQDGINTQVPFTIQGVENPDSYICYTIGGTRYCYGHY